MNKLQHTLKSLSKRQREVYNLICTTKHLRAEGPVKNTCRVLFKLGLIKHSPETENKNDFVLDGPPIKLPPKVNLPKVKNLADSLPEAPKHKPIIWSHRPPTAQYSNISREQHVEKWLQIPVEVDMKPYLPVKCMEEWQMKYIMANYEEMSSKQLAAEVNKEIFEVNLFCHKNAISPKSGKTKPKDMFHNIPPERQMRMQKVGYNGPQKKTA